MIKLFYHIAPNPLKVALLLEEIGLPYEMVPVDIFKGEQHQPELVALNPNRKVPLIVDDDGTVVFDSNAILLYLADKHGQFLGAAEDRGALLSWLMFVATGIGPYSGQAIHFGLIHHDSPYATNRYRREVQRHYDILDERLADRSHILGDAYTIVDMCAWGWLNFADRVLGKEDALATTPHVKRWHQEISARPTAQAVHSKGAALAEWKQDFDEDTRRALFPQNYPSAA